MASYSPPVKNEAFVFYVSLTSQSNTKIAQANPTLAAGDVKVATDDGAPANAATLPAVDADFTKRVKVSLSAGEMNGDNVSVIFSDASGDEWCDLTVNIQTVTSNQFDDLATAANLQTVDDNVDAVLADTNELQTDDVPGLIAALNDLSAADVNAEVDTALADYDGPTAAELTSGLAGLNDLSAAQVNAEVDTALSDYDPPTAAELTSGLAGLNDPTAADIRTEMDSNSTQLAAIVADTNELQTDDVPGLIAALNDVSTADLAAAVASLATAAALATVDGNVDAILADTGTDGVVIATATAQAIADELLKRGIDNVEDAADALSVAALVLATLESEVSGATWTIRKSDGTTFATKTLTTDADAEPVVSVT